MVEAFHLTKWTVYTNVTIELAYREVLLMEHTECLNVNEESAKQYIRMALNVLREAMDTARRVLYAYRPQVEMSGTALLGGRNFLYCTSRPSRISRGKPFYHPSNSRADRRFPSNGASAYGWSLAYPYRRSIPKLQTSTLR